jgi:hypothetical protein
MEGRRIMLSEVTQSSKNVSLTGHSGKINKSRAAHEMLFGKSKYLGEQSVSLKVIFTCFLKFG